ncbi:transcriptional regulator, AraC family [Pelagirhabdus alkalitolerans]|uniref:Transcriptional regulator, AraC family n=1 Tax=Pelagirhabdus alkalitolerans TaxID=1612202 RepID=A0A1G6IVM3_9BACI|nr:AraC family transcriptional regulator [Pelagirhabdus alkalitolerans]SDC10557.1 transcriptional regulator, AraC family [Pelagirhabdus alkalitolerans]
MDILTGMNQAIDYLEDHLTEEIETKELAQLAHCSEYHFKRMFSSLTGIPLSEYIRRRRLSLAVYDLKETDLKIIDVAVKYGYRSADAFTRAFYAMHQVLPSHVQRGEASVVTYSRLTLHLKIEGGISMKYRLVEKDSFNIVGLKKRVAIQFEGVNEEIEKLAQRITPEVADELIELSNVDPKGIINASTHFSEGRMEEQGELDHYIGVATTLDTHHSFDELNVNAGTWAVFESTGPQPETLQNTWGRIYSEWFPTSGYEAVEGPEILWSDQQETDQTEYKTEIWIPVKKVID